MRPQGPTPRCFVLGLAHFRTRPVRYHGFPLCTHFLGRPAHSGGSGCSGSGGRGWGPRLSRRRPWFPCCPNVFLHVLTRYISSSYMVGLGMPVFVTYWTGDRPGAGTGTSLDRLWRPSSGVCYWDVFGFSVTRQATGRRSRMHNLDRLWPPPPPTLDRLCSVGLGCTSLSLRE